MSRVGSARLFRRARVRARSIALLLATLTVAFGTYDASGARADDSSAPPEQVRDDGYDVTTTRPPELLPRERGPAHDELFDPTDIGLTLPDADSLGALTVPNLLPPLTLEPPVDLERLTGDLGAMLPELDLERLQQPVTSLLGTVGEVVDHVQATATAVASGVHSASTRQQAATEDDDTPVTFRLTTTASGVTQTFTLTLCTPTPVNVTSTDPLVPTTVVSLCPVPMALATAVMTPPPGQPFQLYLSAQRIVGTPAVAATIAASYDVPNASGAPLEVRFGYDSGGSAYPANAIVGAATDYNPLTNSAAQHLTMGWATDGPVASLTVEAVGVGRVQVGANPVPADSGSLALSYVNGTFNAQMTRNSAPLSGSSPRVSITAPVPRATGNTNVDLAWTEVSQDFTFGLEPELVDGRPTGVEFSGSQTRNQNSQFGLDVDYITDGVLSARLQQTRFGSQFSESVRTTQDEDGNPVGVRVEASPGSLSTLVLSVYSGGALGAVVELVDIPSTSSTFSFDMKGTGAASQGATVAGTNAPAFIGALSFFTSVLGGTVVPTPQISAKFETGASLTVSPPVAITPGAQIALSVTGVNPSFAIEIESVTATTGNATGVTGFKASGSTPGSATADQLLIEAQADPWTRVRVLMNALGQQWNFRANLHGTLAAPAGLDVHDSNIPHMPGEFKQIHVTQLVSGVYQPLYTFAVQRSGSNTSGAAATAPKSATVFDPPSVFDLSLDYVASTAGNVCTQTLKIKGTNAQETTGYVTLAGNDLLLTASRVFVTGSWHITADTSGPSTGCDPDVFSFTMQQDVGGNPAGQLTASQIGKGRVTLRSFATETWVKVSILRDANRTPTGARIDGGNSEANPGQQIVLEQLSGATTTMALNMWASAAGPVVNGTKGTVVVNNVPPTFGLSANLVKNEGRNLVRVQSYNQAPAPSESMVVTAPAGNLSPGGTVRFVLRSFDVGTDVQVDAPDQALNAGPLLVRVHNANANPNRTEAVAMDVRNAGGTPVFAALLHRPDADTSGLLTSSVNGAFVWSNMPQTFDVEIRANLPAAQQAAISARLEVNVKHASVTPESTMLFTQPAQRAMVAIEGVGTAQRLNLELMRDLTARQAHLHADGTMPDGFRSIQVESLWGDVRDAVFTIYRSGPWRTGYTTRGTNIEMLPSSNQRAFNLTAQMKADEATVQSTSDATGQRINLSQYFFSPSAGIFDHCVWSGSYYPCTNVDLWEMPQAADLTMTSPSPDCGKVKAFPTLKYAGSDSNLRLTVDSLIPCLGGGMAFYGLPAHGVVMDGSLGDMCNAGPQFTLKVTPGFGEVLPYFYIDGWNIKLPMYCSKQYEITGDPLPSGATMRGVVNTLLNYTAGIALQGDAGLTEVAIVPVEDRTGEYSGLQGVLAKGSPYAEFTMGMNLGLGPLYDATTGSLVPNELSWEWEATGLGFIGIAEDWDRFQWYEPYVNYGTDVWLSSYVWEAFPGDTNRYTFSPSSCGNTGTVVNPHTTLAWSPQIPFQPGFTKVNNGVILCGGRVAYYQLNPQNLVMRHCGEVTLWACPGGANTSASNEWSYVDSGWFGYYSDWITAAGMKALYNQDPAALTTRLGTP